MIKRPPVISGAVRLERIGSGEVVDPEAILSRLPGQQLAEGDDGGLLLEGMVPREAFPAAGDLCDWSIGLPTKTAVQLTKIYSDLTDASGLRTETSPLPMATLDTAGFMSGHDKKALEDLKTSVDALQGKIHRLDAYAFTFAEFDPDPEIKAAQEAELTDYAKARLGNVIPENTSVRNLNGGRAFRYSQGSWIDDGYDVVGIATASLAGLVKAGDGSAGTVDVDTGGVMSVAGWSGLELVARRLSAFQVTPDNAHYPTEKLVHDQLALKENAANKTSTINSSSTAAQYPTAKAVFDALDGLAVEADRVTVVNSGSDNAHYPTAKAVWDVVKGKEDVANKTASLSASSTATQYPTAKAVWDALATKENVANKTTSVTSAGTDAQYPSTKAVWTALQTRELSGNKTTTISSSSTDTQYPSAKAVQTLVTAALQTLQPVGMVIAYYGTSAPSGWLICDGSAFSVAVYPKLYAVLGSGYTPDLRGAFVRGLDPGGTRDPDGATRNLGSYQEDAGQKITGTAVVHAHDSTATATGCFSFSLFNKEGPNAIGDWNNPMLSFDSSLVARTATETRPKNVALLFCIRHD
jgi:microcystin-dependent protein